MNIKNLFLALIFFFVVSTNGCSNKDKYESKSYEREITVDGNKTDSIITIEEISSDIITIDSDDDWLYASKYNSNTTNYQLRLVCFKNVSASIRSSRIHIACKNGDKLTLIVIQGVINGLNDLHDIVTDQPALAPER